jgi:hypothetical protein
MLWKAGLEDAILFDGGGWVERGNVRSVVSGVAILESDSPGVKPGLGNGRGFGWLGSGWRSGGLLVWLLR